PRWTKEESKLLTDIWQSAFKDEILATFPERNWKTIRNRALLLQLPLRLKEKFSPVHQAFFSQWSEEMAYVLGFWFADGCMTQPHIDASITFVSKDKNHLELIKKVMRSSHTIHRHGETCFRLRIGSKRLWNNLFTLGGRPAKSLIARVPSIPADY